MVVDHRTIVVASREGTHEVGGMVCVDGRVLTGWQATTPTGVLMAGLDT